MEQGFLRRTQATSHTEAGLVHQPHPATRGSNYRIHDLALFDIAIDSKLRGCDLVRLRIGQLVVNGAARHRATVVQQKTGKPVQFELTQQTRESLNAWLTHRGDGLREFVLPSRTVANGHISTRQYARLVGDWVESIGLGRSAYGTHSLRRTKVAMIYKRSGIC